MSDLTTLSDVKQWLGVSGTNDDALLSRLISALSDFITTWLGRDVTQQSYSNYRDGINGYRMVLRNYPVTSVTTLTVDGVPVPAAVYPSAGELPSPGFIFDQFSIMLVGGAYQFTRGLGNIFVSYQAGYLVVPTEIAQAAIELISLRYKEKDRIGYISKSIAGEIVTFSQKDISDSIETTLANYRRVVQP